ncbi:MAG: hypothetical protein HKO66_11445 [Saprospiraceae bacterium]|nr:hypothetical protein [Bacteroidia bacterium]NNE16169.1 hypothetical protein [Saprospiraceae bacterium]NNL92841.1 hypothetical protein [Saprospiraceae bacterium]
MIRIIILIFFLGAFIINAQAQSEEELQDLIEEINEKKRKARAGKTVEMGINLTQTITQFIPFNESVRRAGPFTFLYRSGKGAKRFNLELGVRIQDDNINNDNYFNLAAGFLKRKEINSKFSYYTSYNGIINFGSFNEPNDTFNDQGTIGFGLGLGFEYKITDNLKLMTETHLILGITDEDPSLNTIPPIGLFLIVDFNKD